MNRVLVIDDDISSVEGLARLLRLDGFDVVATPSSTEALTRIREQHFDALITDLEMPDVHGIEVVRAARSVDPKLPIFVMTAYSDSPITRAAIQAGARCVLDKPLQYDELLATLQREGVS